MQNRSKTGDFSSFEKLVLYRILPIKLQKPVLKKRTLKSFSYNFIPKIFLCFPFIACQEAEKLHWFTKLYSRFNTTRSLGLKV